MGVLGDYEGDVTMTRYYVARRTSEPNEPTGGETEGGLAGVKRMTPEEAEAALNRSRDKAVQADAIAGEWPEGDRTDREPGEGPPVLAYPLRDGETRRWKGEDAELADGFMADALLANWDVVGLELDNVLWDGDHPVRLDQGGTFAFRAQGKRKPYGPVPTEVWTMMSPGGQAFGRMAVTEGVRRRSAAEIGERLTPERVDALVDDAPFADEELRESIRENLKARARWMGDYGAGREEIPDAATPEEGAAALRDGQLRVGEL